MAFYLLELKERGIEAKGELLFPKEKKKEEVVLNGEMEKELWETMDAIRRIAEESQPPRARKIGLCKNCAYKEFCWA